MQAWGREWRKGRQIDLSGGWDEPEQRRRGE